MSALSPVDLGIVAAYFGGTLALGLRMSGKASRGLEEYFLAGRSLPWYLLGLAGMASWFDLTGTMIITSFLYLLGPRGLYIEFRGGAVLILAFLVAYTGKWHRRSGCMTVAEWMTFRFGAGRAAEWMRSLTAIMSIVTTVGMLAYLTRGTSLFVALFVPYSPSWVTAALLFFCGCYTMLGGFRGVVVADAIQGVVVLIACAAVSILAFRTVSGLPSLGALATRVTSNPEWMDTVPRWHTEMPKGYEMYRSLVLFASFYLLRNILWGMGTGGESRYFAARSDRDCGLQSLLQGVAVAFRWPLMIGFAVLGLVLADRLFPDQAAIARSAEVIRHHFPDVTAAHWHDATARLVEQPEAAWAGAATELTGILGAGWREKLPLVGINGTINPELIVPVVIRDSIPAGLRGLIVVAVLAAMMSNLAVTVNGACALVVRDLYQNVLRPQAKTRELILASYAAVFVLLAAGFWMGINAGSINELWGWIVMALGGGALAPWILRLYWWRCNAWGVIGGTVLGGCAAVLLRWIDPQMLEWRQFLLTAALSFGGTIGLSLLTPATDLPTLRRFYRATRPFGWWSRLARELAPEVRSAWRQEHRWDILSVPFIMSAQIAAFLLPMQIVIHAYRSFVFTLPVLVAGVVGAYLLWWKHLPPADLPR